jgi:hypothetical protein
VLVIGYLCVNDCFSMFLLPDISFSSWDR